MFGPEQISKSGFKIADADSSIIKRDRTLALPQYATIAREERYGSDNWNIKRPGDPANMMYWRLDPNKPPSRGAVAGSYSYAIPAQKDGVEFLPLRAYGVKDRDYEKLNIPEAGPDDWLVVATVGHGSREKIAFRSASGSNLILIADHRSDSPPDLSTFVHDGRGDSHDPDRKAGLDTAWEVRKWKPFCNKYATPESEDYSIAWVGDSSPDGKGFCRIGFGSEDGYFSHMASGPLISSFKEKHLLESTTDGPQIAGAISTNAYFRGSRHPFSAPLHFKEEPYPSVMDSDHPYEVHLHYDANKKHPFLCGEKDGMWRWFVRIPIGETPPCTPTKDYERTDDNGNPDRSYAEDSRVYTKKKMISNGVYFQPRVNLTLGRKVNRFLSADN